MPCAFVRNVRMTRPVSSSQSFMSPLESSPFSVCAVSARLPSGESFIAQKYSAGDLSSTSRNSRPAAESQSLTVMSSAADKIWFPSARNIRSCTDFACRGKVRSKRPVAKSQSFTSPLNSPVASRAMSGESANDWALARTFGTISIGVPDEPPCAPANAGANKTKTMKMNGNLTPRTAVDIAHSLTPESNFMPARALGNKLSVSPSRSGCAAAIAAQGPCAGAGGLPCRAFGRRIRVFEKTKCPQWCRQSARIRHDTKLGPRADRHGDPTQRLSDQVKIERIRCRGAEMILDDDIPDVVLARNQRARPEIGRVVPGERCTSPHTSPDAGPTEHKAVCIGVVRHEIDDLAVGIPISVADGEASGRRAVQYHDKRGGMAPRNDDRVVRTN